MILMIQEMEEREPGVFGIKTKTLFDKIDNVVRSKRATHEEVLKNLKDHKRVHLFGDYGDTIALHCFRDEDVGKNFRIMLREPCVAFVCNDKGETIETVRA